ncbi:MAG: Ig-like domain-containing protein [Patescibacteria group bacterium]|nr:Ig-like domain-containing protein [Patescibacteria group bacterium]MDD5715708.1 Ig-like domain-containing protein [Patescibacteria group bacterium]
MNTYKKLLLAVVLIGGASLVAYIAMAQTDQTAVPSFEIASSAGPMLGSCSNTTCTDPVSCANACDGVWNATVNVSPGSVEKNQVITMTLRATDPSGVQGVQARIKNAGNTQVALIALYDDGAHHDASRLDGIWGEAWNVGNNADGTYTVDILMVDRLGNQSESTGSGQFMIGQGPCANNFDCDAGQKCCLPPGVCSVDSCATDADCDDGSASTADVCNTTLCPVSCTHTVITECADDDGYCPTACVPSNDNNCVDTTPPIVSFTAPATDGFEITATPYSVKVSATDPETPVQRVEFYYGGILRETQYAPGGDGLWTWIWDLGGVPNTAPATTQIQARAYNAPGLTTTASRNVIINIPSSNTAPTATITTPANGAVVSGIVNVGVTATDDTSVTMVRLFRSGYGMIGENTTSGATVNTTFSWNATATAQAYVESGISQYAMEPAARAKWRLPFIPVANATIVCSTCTSTTYYSQPLYARAYDAEDLYGESAYVTVTTPITSTYSCNCYDDAVQQNQAPAL